MSLKKTAAVVAAAGALAAISVPAMAFENEFHGTYTFNSIFSNFAKGDGAQVNPAANFSTKGSNVTQMNNYFEQRARLQYIAKASDDLKLVTHFELDTRFGGITDGKYAGSSDAGGLDADGISLETKHVYLDFNLTPNVNVKTGIQPYKDTLKGLFLDADVPAVVTTTKLGAYTLGVGYTRVSEQAAAQTGTPTARLGDLATDIFILDNTFALNKDTKVAFSYYLLADYKTKNAPTNIHTFGLSGESKVGGLTLSGLVALQAGNTKNMTDGTLAASTPTANGASTYYHGWAANVAAKAAAGPGTFRTALTFVSGDNQQDNRSNRGWQNAGVNSYNESGLMIIARNTAQSPTNTDDYLRRMVTNIALATVGYDANLSDKLFVNSNLGFAWVPASLKGQADTATFKPRFNPKNNGCDFMGTEINTEIGYKLYKNLTLQGQAAYMFLGGFYKNDAMAMDGTTHRPDNPYTLRLQAKFAF